MSHVTKGSHVQALANPLAVALAMAMAMAMAMVMAMVMAMALAVAMAMAMVMAMALAVNPDHVIWSSIYSPLSSLRKYKLVLPGKLLHTLLTP
jgi:Na+(H+)/acetate symporter ActP